MLTTQDPQVTLEGEAYKRGREDGIRQVISWLIEDGKEYEAIHLKKMFPQYYTTKIDKHGHYISFHGEDLRDADNHSLTERE